MPPSRHSSSHHSSSHHSSHSSSHHSSSRSYSSRSSHSSSHHNSSYGSSSSGLYGSTYTGSRNRSSQPRGWTKIKNYKITRHICNEHDYDYYPVSWTDADGNYYKEGYYDEDGKYYDNVLLTDGSTMLRCEYCNNHMLYKYENGSIPVCNKCGAQFTIDTIDKEKRQFSFNEFSYASGNTKLSLGSKIALVIFILICLLPFICIIGGIFVAISDRGDKHEEPTKTQSVKNSVYVKELGRTCYLDGEDWYDKETDCWFYYNDEVEPYQWQYWYNGISSNYGDFGWMEYDMGEEAWYIETSYDNWVHVPDEYNTSNLWHMTDEYTNEY